MAENKENIEIDKTDKTDANLDNRIINSNISKREGDQSSKNENLVEVKNNIVQGENLTQIEQFLKDIDNLDMTKNNLEKNLDNQNNNVDTNEQQNTNQSSIASSVQTNSSTANRSSSTPSSSSDSQISDKLEVRIVDKNNLETDVVATLRDPVNDYRVDEPKIQYEPKVKEKIQLELEMTISSQSVEEGSTAIFAVSFDKVMDKPYTVTFNTSTNGSAESTDINPSIVVKDSKGNIITANTDGSYTVPAGEQNLTVEILTNNDNSYEGNETFELNGKTEFMNSNTSGTGIIKDDGTANDGNDGDSLIDNDKPSMTIGNVTVEEGSKAIFAVTLDKIAEIPYKVTFNTSNNTTSNSDYNSTFTVKDSNGNIINPNGDGSYTVPAGETNLTVEVSTTDDSIYEISETFKLNGKTEFMNSNTSGTATIKDDGTASDGDDNDSIPDNDSPTMTIGKVSVEEGSNAVFDVTVTEATAPYTVTFNTSTNGTASSSDINSTFIVKDSNGTVIAVNGDGSYTVPAGETNLKVEVPTTTDAIYEGSETFELNGKTEFMSSNTQGTGSILDDGSATDGNDSGTGIDNDKPTLTLADAIMEEGSTLVFAGSLSNATAFNEEITLSSVLGSAESSDFNSDKTTWTVTYVDGNSATQTLSVDINGKFTLPSGITSFDVKIPTINDNVYEGSEDFTLSANATSSYITDTDTATGTITDDGTTSNINAVDGDDSDSSVDDDTTKFSINDANTYEGNTITFTVTRIGDAEANQTVDYAATIETGNTAETEDFTGTLTGTLTFATGETSKTITLSAPSIVDANSDVGDDTFTVTLSNNSVGSTILDAVGIGTIKESNTPPAGTDKTIALGKNTSYVLSVSDFGYSDSNGDAFSKIKITTLENNGKLLYFDGTSWGDVTLDQEISKTAIDNGYLVFKPDSNEVGVPYTTFQFEVNDGTSYDTSANIITYNIGNTLSVSNPLPVDEGKSAIFTVSLDEARGVDTLLNLVIGGVSSTSDYNTTLYYKKIALDGQSWSWEVATSNQITIASGQTELEVKVTTLSDAVSDDKEPLNLTANIIGGTNTDMANTSATGSTTINDNPSLVIDTKPYITEGDFAVFEVSLSSPKSTDTTISLGGGGTATWGTDYSQNYEYSTDDGITWQSISSFTVTIPGSLTTTPSVLIRTQTTSDGVSEPDETITLIATTTDSGISTKTVDATTTVVDQLNLTVYENGDDTSLNSQANSVTLSADSIYTYAILGQGVNGSVEQSGDNLIYTPNIDFSGTDTFTYVRTEIATGLSVSGVATVTVNANADTPDIEISANVAVIENVVDSTSWKLGSYNGNSISSGTLDYSVSSVDISSVNLSGSQYIMQSFNGIDGMSLDLSWTSTYTYDNSKSPDLTAYWATLSGTTVTVGAVITNIEDLSTTTVTIPTGSGYNTIILANTGPSTTSLVFDSLEFKQSVGSGNIIYDVNIYNALTDIDTVSAQNEQLQNITLQVKDSSGTVINSTDFFNQGTYDSSTKTWTFTQAQLDNLQITVSTTLSSNGFKLEAVATSMELSNNSTATNTVTIDIISSNDTPIIGDQTLQVLNAQASTNGTNIDTYYSGDESPTNDSNKSTKGLNVFSWDPSKSNIPDLYADGQKVVITYDNDGTVTGTINNGAKTIFTTTIAMADTDGTTLNYAQGSELLGVVNMIDGDIILPGGGNNDYRIFQFTASDGDPTVVVDALVSAHNLIEDTYDEINNIGAGAGAEHTVNTNNYYIGVDSNNMNAGQQLIFDFNTISTYDSITTNKNEVSEINIKLFNFGSEKSGDELFITVITKDPNNVGSVLREDILLTQDSDYTSELEYTVQSSTGNPIVGVEFLAGNESSFKLGIESIGSINYNDTFEMDFAYDITDVDGDTDSGLTTIQIGSGTINTSLDYNLDSAIVYDSTDVTINGGAGTDTLVLDNGIDIDFSTYTSDINDIEQIDMTDTTSANILSNIALQDIIDITDSSNLMTILGDAGDTVSLDTENGNTWSTTGIADSDGFKTYVNSGDNSVSLKIDADITTTII